MSEIMINISNLYKAYKNNVLFENMQLQVEKGSVCGIVGQNGSGKSVLLKMLCGLACADEGKMVVNGDEVDAEHFPHDIGVILDCTGFLPGYTGIQNLEMIADIRKCVSKKEIEDLMRLVGLDPHSKVRVGKYSLGMKQHLAFVQAIMEKPSLLILDEPTNGVDQESQQLLRSMLKDMNQKEHVTMILTSHNQMDIEELCDSVYQIEQCSLRQLR